MSNFRFLPEEGMDFAVRSYNFSILLGARNIKPLEVAKAVNQLKMKQTDYCYAASEVKN